MRALAFAAVFALAAPAAVAQEASTFKCLDREGRVTYTNTACDRLGLRFAALVGERLSVIAVSGYGRPGGLPGAGASVPLR